MKITNIINKCDAEKLIVADVAVVNASMRARDVTNRPDGRKQEQIILDSHVNKTKTKCGETEAGL